MNTEKRGLGRHVRDAIAVGATAAMLAGTAGAREPKELPVAVDYAGEISKLMESDNYEALADYLEMRKYAPFKNIPAERDRFLKADIGYAKEDLLELREKAKESGKLVKLADMGSNLIRDMFFEDAEIRQELEAAMSRALTDNNRSERTEAILLLLFQEISTAHHRDIDSPLYKLIEIYIQDPRYTTIDASMDVGMVDVFSRRLKALELSPLTSGAKEEYIVQGHAAIAEYFAAQNPQQPFAAFIHYEAAGDFAKSREMAKQFIANPGISVNDIRLGTSSALVALFRAAGVNQTEARNLLDALPGRSTSNVDQTRVLGTIVKGLGE